MANKVEKATLLIQRFDPYTDKTPHFTEYVLEYRRNDQLLDLFNRIKTDRDSTFSYRRSCRHGICGSCAVKVNGKPILACRTPVHELIDEFGPTLTVTPIDTEKIIHDLVIDMDEFWKKHDKISPFLTPQQHSGPQSSLQGSSIQGETLFFDSSSASIGDADYCIQCGACYYVCPVISVQPSFLGPAALTKAFRFINDPRDTQSDRLEVVFQPQEGVWECIKCLKCTEVCPKHIDPFSKISRLHSQVILSSQYTSGSRIRHTKGFQLDLLLNGMLNELPLALFALRIGFIKMAIRGIRMLFHGKVVLNPFKPRSKGYKQIRKLMRDSQ